MDRVGLMTSGGDAPGMNAAIRGVFSAAFKKGVEVVGIRRGYQGMIENDMFVMQREDVAGIIHRGGTILKSARSADFRTTEGRTKAAENLKAMNVSHLVVIGGDGTFTGAKIFGEEYDFKIVGLPGTIDNDLFGTDYTIGYDTALNTVVEAVDRIRDTASAHDRLFFVEVMGKDAGFIALRSGIASAADAILIPETPTDADALIAMVKNWSSNREHGIVIVAEGDDAGGALKIAEKVSGQLPDVECKVTILGHIQRGGAPSAWDRILATSLGVASIDYLLQGSTGIMLGMVNREVKPTDFAESIKHHSEISKPLLDLAETLSC